MANAANNFYQNVELRHTPGIQEDPPPSYSEAIASAKVPIQQSLKSTSDNPDATSQIQVIETPPSLLTVMTPPSQQINTDHSYDNIGFSNTPSDMITNQPTTSTNNLGAKRYTDVGANGPAQSNTNNHNDDCCNNPEACFLGCLCCVDICRCLLLCCECAIITQC